MLVSLCFFAFMLRSNSGCGMTPALPEILRSRLLDTPSLHMVKSPCTGGTGQGDCDGAYGIGLFRIPARLYVQYTPT